MVRNKELTHLIYLCTYANRLIRQNKIPKTVTYKKVIVQTNQGGKFGLYDTTVDQPIIQQRTYAECVSFFLHNYGIGTDEKQ